MCIYIHIVYVGVIRGLYANDNYKKCCDDNDKINSNLSIVPNENNSKKKTNTYSTSNKKKSNTDLMMIHTNNFNHNSMSTNCHEKTVNGNKNTNMYKYVKIVICLSGGQLADTSPIDQSHCFGLGLPEPHGQAPVAI